MKELDLFKKKCDRFQGSLSDSISHFRKGNDPIALDEFLNSMDDLEDLLCYQQYTGDIRIRSDVILLILKTLYDSIWKKDLLKMVDILEFKLYPLIDHWIKGWASDDYI